ncbi:MAG TPA: LysR family transcriptional regulator [Parvularculaceae bacterium]|nr:LysR family transcriptional regulator [Amphiplicatus sp.]MCB9956741.1 LysR family transcriptional regulator [Caulobacterales bacterium]HOP18518.1 LysR family transcriptional regulator [Amphiplicatus sp.]HPE29676.1 LysR family transcriptional regulator [Parvularculaceae bacterium]HRX38598.1 LysR family transcriptional regulator [Parvularculaceae bacterium]
MIERKAGRGVIVPGDPEIKLLRLFRTIVNCGGFTMAQSELNVSQSTISTQMAQLESRLGVRLCERGHGVFRLTPEGEQVLAAADRLFAALEDFRNDISEAKENLAGELRLGIMDNSITDANSPLSETLSRFALSAPDVFVNVFIGGMADLEERVLDGRLHTAIAFTSRCISGLIYTPLYEEQHTLYCGRRHPFFSLTDDEISKEDLQAADFVGWGYKIPKVAVQLPLNFNEVAASSYMEGVAYLVLSGRYIAYLPSHYAQIWVDKGEMRPLFEDVYSATAPINIITRSEELPSKIAKNFIDSLLATAGRAPGGA